jgi:hypothetical protein
VLHCEGVGLIRLGMRHRQSDHQAYLLVEQLRREPACTFSCSKTARTLVGPSLSKSGQVQHKILSNVLTEPGSTLNMNFIAQSAASASRDVPHTGGDGSKTARTLVCGIDCEPTLSGSGGANAPSGAFVFLWPLRLCCTQCRD